MVHIFYSCDQCNFKKKLQIDKEEPLAITGDCSFVENLLKGTYLAGRGKINCSKIGKTLGDHKLKDAEVLLQRCGRQLDDFSDFDYSICSNHFELLSDTDKFEDKYRQYCLCPHHKKGAKHAAKDLMTLSLQEVQDLWTFQKEVFPYGGRICKTCRVDWLSKQRKEIKKKKEALAAEYEELRNEAFDEFEAEVVSPTKSAASDESWQLDFKSKLQEMRMHLNRLNILNRIKKVKVKDTLSKKKIEAVSKRRQYEIMRNAGASIASVLHTVYAYKREDDTFDDGTLWNMIKESNVVENFLDNVNPISSLLAEIINSCNSTADPRLRVQILSLIVNEVSYPFIAQHCNPIWYRDRSSVSKEEEKEERAVAAEIGEVQEMDPEEANKVLVPDIQIPEGLRFEFPVTRHMWRRAGYHYKQHKCALAPVTKKKTARWHWDLETVRAVVDFVSDPMNTQQVAYGTLR